MFLFCLCLVCFESRRQPLRLVEGTRAEAAPLPCENHVRELRTFFTLSQSHASNVHFFCETLSLLQDFQRGAG